MKLAIDGFSQKAAVELGMSIEDLILLRWFVDYKSSAAVTTAIEGDVEYCIVDYGFILREMPILGLKKRGLALRFSRLVSCGVLSHVTIRRGGTFSAYAIGPAFYSLISDGDIAECSHGNAQGVVTEMTTPPGQNQIFVNNESNRSSYVRANEKLTLDTIRKPTYKHLTNVISIPEDTPPIIPPTGGEPSVDELISNADLSDGVKNALKTWVMYKTEERRQKYSLRGLACLISAAGRYERTYGTENVVNVIEESIANRYQGVLWKSISSGKRSAPETQIYTPKSKPYQAAKWLADTVCSRMPSLPSHSEQELQKAAAVFDTCHSSGHSWDEISDLLSFSQDDAFWRQCVIDAEAFSRNYVKILASWRERGENEYRSE